MMLGTVISSFLFIICSSVFGMPISGTHTVVGALIGSGLAAMGSDNINWGKLSMIVASWFVAPLVAAVFAIIVMSTVAGLTMNPKGKLSTRLLWLTIITALSCSLIATMVISVIKEKDDPFTVYHWTTLAIAFVGGLITSRIVLLVLTIGKESLSFGILMGTLL
jgi:phosphate/sulfate permease